MSNTRLVAHRFSFVPEQVEVTNRDGFPNLAVFWADGREIHNPFGWKDQKLVYCWLEPGEYALTATRKDKTEQVDLDVPALATFTETVKHPDGKPFYVRKRGNSDVYTMSEQSYRAMEIPKGAIVMDLGAHIGTFTRLALHKGAGRVVAYEPEPDNFTLLYWNTASQGLPVEPVRGAMSSGGETELTFYVNPGICSTIHSLDKVAGRVPLPVPAVDFQTELLRVQPDVLKIDIEGGEYGLDMRIPDSVRHIGMEIHTKHDEWREQLAPRLLGELAAQGFQLVKPVNLDKGARIPVGIFKR